MALIPAVLMTYVCASFVFVSGQFLGMENRTAAYLLGGAATLLVSAVMFVKFLHHAKGDA